jgi:hypothetical protein
MWLSPKSIREFLNDTASGRMLQCPTTRASFAINYGARIVDQRGRGTHKSQLVAS